MTKIIDLSVPLEDSPSEPRDIVMIQTGADRYWGAHYAGIHQEYCHIEKLANLDRLPGPFGFKVACFPVRLAGGSAGWSRVVAIIED
jgi:kynurenine formamidase